MKNHGPARAVTAHLVEAPVAVLVPSATFVGSAVDMGMPVRVHDVFGTQHAAERTYDRWIVKDRAQLGHARQHVVARIAFLFKNFFRALVDALMHLGRQLCIEFDKAVYDELFHLLIAEQIRWVDQI